MRDGGRSRGPKGGRDRHPRNRHPYRRPARQSRFVRAMVERGVLSFGDFELKSGRRSPYFMNLALVCDAPGLAVLGGVFAAEVRRLPTPVDVLFGPAYKGITIAVSAAMALANDDSTVGVAYNRKETKEHGEGGLLVGAPLGDKRVVIVDDVVTDGGVKREAFDMVTAAGGEVVGVVLAFDRQEPQDLDDPGGVTAVQALERDFGVPVRCVANLDDVLACLRGDDRYAVELERLREYRLQLRGPRAQEEESG